MREGNPEMNNIFDLFKKIEKSPVSNEPISFLLAGLGNPGTQYEKTRHNAGFRTIDRLAEKKNVKIDRAKFKGLCGEVIIGGKRGLLLKPQTFMNLSGEAVAAAVDFYKLPLSSLVVICDDISLAPGKIRVRKKGSDGGQKGLRSIITLLGTDEFVRIRMGVGAKPNPEYDLADWVLGCFNKDDDKLFCDAVEKVCDNIETVIAGDIDRAMNILN